MSLVVESTVEFDAREVTVVSQVLLEPEPMIVTRVSQADVVLRKSHVALPPSAVRDATTKGPDALRATLQVHHLRFVQSLLAVAPGAAPASQASARSAGELGALVLGPAGEVLGRAGEEQVPAGWLRAAYLVSGMADLVGARLGLGSPLRAAVAGTTLAARLSREGDTTRVVFVDVAALPRASLDGFRQRAEELACNE